MTVLVVGAGIVGASVAFRLAAAGATVTLLDAGRPGGGTSAATFAWINANSKGPFAYHLLNVCGMAEHLTLCRELENAAWLHQSGNLEWAVGERGEAALRARTERLRAWGYPVERLTRRELRSLEPDVALPDGVEEAVLFPTEGYVDVPPLVGALVAAARRAGARVLPGTPVVEISRTGDRVTGVVTADGSRLAADRVVSCVGHRTAALARLAGVTVPVGGVPGLSFYTHAAPVRLRAIVHTPEVSLRPDGGGRFVVRAAEFDAGVAEDAAVWPLPQAADILMARATAVLPGLAGTPVEAARVGVRPMPDDEYPLVGPAPGCEGFYVVCTHSAVTLGPLLGRLVAREIVDGVVDERIAPYRTGRPMLHGAVG